jgi:hypothetical protein
MGLARYLPDFHFPRFMGFRQFGPKILTFEKQAKTALPSEFLSITQKLGQRRTGPGGNHIEDFSRGFFHSRGAYGDSQTYPLGSGMQESGFLGGGLVERD